MSKSDNKVDWQQVAVRQASKLNAIACELDSIEHNSSIFDCVFMARELKSKFNLELNGDYVKPDFDVISNLNDDLGVLLARYEFTSFSERDAMFQKVLKKHGELNSALAVYGAFV